MTSLIARRRCQQIYSRFVTFRSVHLPNRLSCTHPVILSPSKPDNICCIRIDTTFPPFDLRRRSSALIHERAEVPLPFQTRSNSRESDSVHIRFGLDRGPSRLGNDDGDCCIFWARSDRQRRPTIRFPAPITTRLKCPKMFSYTNSVLLVERALILLGNQIWSIEGIICHLLIDSMSLPFISAP